MSEDSDANEKLLKKVQSNLKQTEIEDNKLARQKLTEQRLKRKLKLKNKKMNDGEDAGAVLESESEDDEQEVKGSSSEDEQVQERVVKRVKKEKCHLLRVC